MAKIEQHPDVKSILLSTGDCVIVEHTTNDSYWGDGGDGKGKNMLGHLLMDIRNNLENYKPEFFLPQWIAYPEIEPFSIGWRMEYGETYLSYLWKWRAKQSPEALKEYDDYFTPPGAWSVWVEARKMQEAISKESNED